MSRLDFEEYRKVTQQVVSYDLHIAPQHISTAFRALVDAGIVEVGVTKGRKRAVRLNRRVLLEGRVPPEEDVVCEMEELIRRGAWPADENRAIDQSAEDPF